MTDTELDYDLYGYDEDPDPPTGGSTWAEGLLGLSSHGAIVDWVPLNTFVILFGLSMDYHVFILSRIHEEYHRTGDPKASVITGLSASARVITAAAANTIGSTTQVGGPVVNRLVK